MILIKIKLFVIFPISCFGDWGLGIGDWAIPNPQSPIPN